MAAPELPRLPSVISDLNMTRLLVSVFRQRGAPVSFDIETTGLDPRQNRLVSIQLQQSGRIPAVIDCRKFETQVHLGEVPGDDLYFLGQELQPLFDGTLLIIGHNLKFDLGFLRQRLGIKAKRVYDTMIAEQLIHGVGKSDARAQGVGLTLKSLAASYDVGEMSKEERSWFIDLDQRPEWELFFPEEQLRYAGMDVAVLFPLYQEQGFRLRELDLTPVAKLEMRCLPALVEVEHAGVLVDRKGWEQFIQEKEAEAAGLANQALETFGPPILRDRQIQYDIAKMEWEAWDAARSDQENDLRGIWDSSHDTGYPNWGQFKNTNMKLWRAEHPNPGKPKPDTSLPNLGSTKQLLVAMETLGIPATDTKAETLKQLEDDYPPIKLLTDWRRAEKFVTSFGESLLRFVDNTTGRIHPEYVQIGASTGRMACSRPNWQQVPSKGDGSRLRALVKAAPEHVILTADFSNIELRILADMSGDARMLESFAGGLDLHAYTARMMFALGEEVDVKHEDAFPGVSFRAVAKTINFGLVYGMSATKLARTLKITREKAVELFEAYFSLYPGVGKWLEEQRSFGLRRMESYTLAGRRRFYSMPAEPVRPLTRDVAEIEQWMEARSHWKAQRHRIERQACNTPVQGTSADITKLALAILHEQMQESDYPSCHVIAIVHDEIVVEVPTFLADEIARLLAKSMEAAADTYLHRVTLPPVEVAVSDHWSKE